MTILITFAFLALFIWLTAISFKALTHSNSCSGTVVYFFAFITSVYLTLLVGFSLL